MKKYHLLFIGLLALASCKREDDILQQAENAFEERTPVGYLLENIEIKTTNAQTGITTTKNFDLQFSFDYKLDKIVKTGIGAPSTMTFIYDKYGRVKQTIQGVDNRYYYYKGTKNLLNKVSFLPNASSRDAYGGFTFNGNRLKSFRSNIVGLPPSFAFANDKYEISWDTDYNMKSVLEKYIVDGYQYREVTTEKINFAYSDLLNPFYNLKLPNFYKFSVLWSLDESEIGQYFDTKSINLQKKIEIFDDNGSMIHNYDIDVTEIYESYSPKTLTIIDSFQPEITKTYTFTYKVS